MIKRRKRKKKNYIETAENVFSFIIIIVVTSEIADIYLLHTQIYK